MGENPAGGFQMQVQAKNAVDAGGLLANTSVIPPVSFDEIVSALKDISGYAGIPADMRSRTVSSLADGETYIVKFRACAPGCRLLGTFEVTAGAPLAPANFTPSGKHDGFRLRWDAPADNGAAITNYDLRWVEHGGNILSAAAHSFGPGASAGLGADNGVQLGKIYDVQVRAENIRGKGVWSDVQSGIAAALNDTLPSIGANLSVRATQTKRQIIVSVPAGNLAGESLRIRWGAQSEPAVFLNQGGADGWDVPSVTENTLDDLLVQEYFFEARPHHADHAPGDWSQRAAGKPLGGTNPNLSALALSGGAALSPAFTPNTLRYTAEVGAGVESVRVAPVRNDRFALVHVNGSEIARGGESGDIPLGAAGSNTLIMVVVTAEKQSPARTYVITVARAAAAEDNDLAGLAISEGALSPQFSAANLAYSASVAANITGIRVTPTASDAARAMLSVGGRAVESGAQSARQALAPGADTGIMVVVAAENRGLTQTYTLTVTRAGSTAKSADASLLSADFRGADGAALTLVPAFTSATTAYSVAVPSTISHFTAKASPAHPAATMAFQNLLINENPPQAVQGGMTDERETEALALKRAVVPIFNNFQTLDMTKFTISVTPEDGSAARVYAFTLTRGEGAPSSPVLEPVIARIKGMTLAWSPPADGADLGSDISGYRYRWSNDEDADWESEGGADGVEIANSASLRHLTVRGLTPYTPYTLQMAAVNAGGTGRWSASSPAVMPQPLPQGAPYPVTLVGEHRKILVQWQAPPGGAPDEYKVRWAEGLGSMRWINRNGADGESAGGDLRHTIADLSNGVIYEVQAGARYGGNIFWGDLMPGMPNPPSDIFNVQFCDARDVRGGSLCARPLEIAPPLDLLKYDGYTVRVPLDASAVRVLAETAAGGDFEGGNGEFAAAASGVFSNAAALAAAGEDTVVSVKSAAAAQSYAFRITRSADSRLSALGISAGALSPAFDPAETTYAALVEHAVTGVTLQPVANDPAGTTIRVDGSPLSGPDSREIGLSAGIPKTVLVEVAASDNATTYRVTLTRQVRPVLRFAQAQADLRFYSGSPVTAVALPPVAAAGAPDFTYALRVQSEEGLHSLPAGLLFDRQSRELSGTPADPGGETDYTMLYYALDSSTPSAFGEQEFTVSLAAPLAVAPSSITFTFNTPAGETILPAASGGFAPLSYALRGVLPPGLSFAPGPRALTGVPTQTGDYAVSYHVADGMPSEASADINLLVRPLASAKPTGLTAASADGSLQLRWIAPSDTGGEAPGGYRVRWKRENTGVWLNNGGEAGESADAGNFHTITGLDNGVAYTVQVAAVNGAGTGAWSDEALSLPSAVLAFERLQENMVIFAGAVPQLDLPLAQDGAEPYTYEVSGLPAGLSFSSTEQTPARIAADPSEELAAGASEITYTVTDDDSDSVEHLFTITVRDAFHLDVNGGGAGGQDGILIARYLLGVQSGAGLTGGQSGMDAGDVASLLKDAVDAGLLDVDDSGETDGTDGLLIARYLLGLRGAALTAGLVEPGEEKTTADVVDENMQKLLQMP